MVKNFVRNHAIGVELNRTPGNHQASKTPREDRVEPLIGVDAWAEVPS